MGCINSSNTIHSTSPVQNPSAQNKDNSSQNRRIIQAIQSGNIKLVKQLINYTKIVTQDLTSITGHQSKFEVDEFLEWETDNWTPVLLAIVFNQYDILRYFIEDLKLNPLIYLIKPKSVEEVQIELITKNSLELQKDYKRYKTKLEKYNRIVSITLACKHKNAKLLEFLLDSHVLKYFWTKKDFEQMIHFISGDSKIWQFAIPILLSSHLAHRWFYQEKEVNKVDIFYRLQRHFNIKILLDEMIHQIQAELVKPPYSASFFISLSNQEFVDDKVPDISQLRDCVKHLIQFDFTMIHEEVRYFDELKRSILKRFDVVTSYKDIVNQFCSQIEEYLQDEYKMMEEIDLISTAIMRQDIHEIESYFSKYRIENVNQINLRIQLDHRFKNTNLLSSALCNNKTEVIEYLLDKDMIDIISASKKSPTSHNVNTLITRSETPARDLSQFYTPISSKKLGFVQLKFMKEESIMQPKDSRSTMNGLFDPSPSNFLGDSKGFTSTNINFSTITHSNGFQEQSQKGRNGGLGRSRLAQKKKPSQYLLPIEILIGQRHKDLFLKMWDKFVYQFTYLDFNHILTILNQDVKSEEWFRSFMQRTSTRQFFEGLKLRDQLDFIEKLLTAFEYFQGQTNDMLVQDLDQLKDDEKNQSFNTILLLKPCTFEILHQEPYVQTVFLHCFLNYKRDKKLYDHIQKGFIRVSSKIKFEFYIEFEDLITDKSWAFYKNKFMTMNNNVYSINLQPSYDQQFATMNGTNDKMITLIKAQQISDIGGESMKLSQPEFEYNQQNTDGSLEKIEKIYESFFNSLKTPIYTNIRQNMKV